MNNERIKLWTDALRSGKYKQSRFNLRDQENNYCCLGVACCVYEKQTKKKLSEKQWTDGYLPLEVAVWFGFDKNPLARNYNSCPPVDLPITKDLISATKANDGKEWSFTQIADAVEKTYLKDES